MKCALLLVGGCLVMSSCASSPSTADPTTSAPVSSAEATTSTTAAPETTEVASGETLPPVVVGDVTFTPSVPGGRSRFADNYFADVLGAELVGEHSVAVRFDAQGQTDLRSPGSTCLVHEDGYVAMPMSTDLEVDTPGRFTGVLTFRLIVAGGWSLRYSCKSDYSDVFVGTIEFDSVGTSAASDNNYATVLSATNDSSGNVAVRLLAHGSDMNVGVLSDPDTSCLLIGDTELRPVEKSFNEQVFDMYFDGTFVFATAGAGSAPVRFVYSCSADYPTLTLGE